jgi:phospholipid/cholesterol/gamma-HCH transport system permease protein
MNQVLGYIGRKTIMSVSHVLDLFAFACRLLRVAFKRPKAGRALVRRMTAEQIYYTGVQALPVIIPIAVIIGSMLIVQLAKVSGEYNPGKTTVLLIVRELGPIITALLVILRSTTAITTEISYMKVLNEIDAIEMAGVDPMVFVCLPRFIGIIAAILCLFVVFDLASLIGGYTVVWLVTFIPMGDYLHQMQEAVTLADIFEGILKAVFFGMTITVTCLYRGLRIEKQITRIPVITSRASVECFFYCLLINVIISIVFYL